MEFQDLILLDNILQIVIRDTDHQCPEEDLLIEMKTVKGNHIEEMIVQIILKDIVLLLGIDHLEIIDRQQDIQIHINTKTEEMIEDIIDLHHHIQEECSLILK